MTDSLVQVASQIVRGALPSATLVEAFATPWECLGGGLGGGLLGGRPADGYGWLWRGSCHLCPLAFGGPLATACCNGVLKCEVLLFQEVFHCIAIPEALNVLITDALLRTLVGAELARFGQLAQGY